MKKYKMELNKFLLIVGAVFAALGIIFMLMGQNQATNDTVPATASVSDYVEDTCMEGRLLVTVYYPLLTYDVDGQTVTSQYSEHFDEQPYEIGDKINIKYNPDDPEEFFIVGDDIDSGTNGAWAVVLGIAMVIVGLVLTIKNKFKAGKN